VKSEATATAAFDMMCHQPWREHGNGKRAALCLLQQRERSKKTVCRRPVMAVEPWPVARLPAAGKPSLAVGAQPED
jgi:hypothetical protein